MDRVNIVSHNIRGIATPEKRAEIDKFLSENNTHILLLQETFLNSKHAAWNDNYSIIRRDRDSHGGGVAIYINKSIKFKTVQLKKFSCIETVAISIKVNCPCKTTEVTIVNVYITKANRLLKSELIELFKIENVVICGDFNAIHKDWSTGSENLAGRIIHSIFPFNGNILFATNEPTLMHHTGAKSTIDFIVTNCALYSDDLHIVSGLISDHLPIAFTLSAKPAARKKKTIYDYDHANWLQYEHLMKNFSIDYDLNNKERIHNAVNELVLNIRTNFDLAVPKKVK